MDSLGESSKAHSWSSGDITAFSLQQSRLFESSNCNPSLRTPAKGDGLLGDTPLLPFPQSQVVEHGRVNRRRTNVQDARVQPLQRPFTTHTSATSRSSVPMHSTALVGSQAPPFGGHLPRRWTFWIDHPHRKAGLSDDFRIETTVSLLLRPRS